MDANTGKIEIRNLTESGIVINSLKLFLPPEASVIRKAADGQDGDVVALMERGLISVGEPKPKAPKSVKQEKPANQQRPAEEEEEPTDPESKFTSPGDQMGREVTIIDQGVVRRTKMNPGMHNTSDPKFIDSPPPESQPPENQPQPQAVQQPEAKQADEDGEKHPAFIEIGG